MRSPTKPKPPIGATIPLNPGPQAIPAQAPIDQLDTLAMFRQWLESGVELEAALMAQVILFLWDRIDQLESMLHDGDR